MVVIKNVALAASLLAPLALAVPMPGSGPRGVRTLTVTEYAMVTVEETVTVWVGPSETPAPASTTAPAPAPAVFAESSSTSAAAAPSPPPVLAAAPPAAPTTSSPAAVAPAAPTTTTTTSSPAPVAPSSTMVAAAPSSSPASVNVQPREGSTTGTCEGSGNACVGDVTHWDGGLGACGWDVDTKSEMQIALPFEFMGTLSNSNPYCGRSVTLFNPNSGTTVQATVGDKCMGCVDRAIDCTDILFDAITDGQGDGRMSGIEWWFS